MGIAEAGVPNCATRSCSIRRSGAMIPIYYLCNSFDYGNEDSDDSLIAAIPVSAVVIRSQRVGTEHQELTPTISRQDDRTPTGYSCGIREPQFCKIPNHSVGTSCLRQLKHPPAAIPPVPSEIAGQLPLSRIRSRSRRNQARLGSAHSYPSRSGLFASDVRYLAPHRAPTARGVRAKPPSRTAAGTLNISTGSARGMGILLSSVAL